MIHINSENLHNWPKKIKVLSCLLFVCFALCVWTLRYGRPLQHRIQLATHQQQLLTRQVHHQQQTITTFKHARRKLLPLKKAGVVTPSNNKSDLFAQLYKLAAENQLVLTSIKLESRNQRPQLVMSLSGHYQALLSFLNATTKLPEKLILAHFQLAKTADGIHFLAAFSLYATQSTQGQ